MWRYLTHFVEADVALVTLGLALEFLDTFAFRKAFVVISNAVGAAYRLRNF